MLIPSRKFGTGKRVKGSEMMTIKQMKCHDINTAVKQSDCNTCLCVFLYCLLRFGAYFHNGQSYL